MTDVNIFATIASILFVLLVLRYIQGRVIGSINLKYPMMWDIFYVLDSFIFIIVIYNAFKTQQVVSTDAFSLFFCGIFFALALDD